MAPDRFSVGIDLGGSRLRGGLVSQDGQLVARVETRTEAERGVPGVLANLKRVIAQLLDSSDPSRVAGIGIAAAGQIHPATHAVVYAPNLNWKDVPCATRSSRPSGCRPTSTTTSVPRRGASTGSGWAGGAKSLIAVFVGTGVGSGAVVNGMLLAGHDNAAGELGHTQVVMDGLPCLCGQSGCVETYASGIGFVRRVEAALAQQVETSLAADIGGDPRRVTAALVERAAAAGDALARLLWTDAERYLGMALANYVTLLNPELLVLGGGIMLTSPSLADALAEQVARRATVMSRGVRVAVAALGDSAGIFGAADRVWLHL